MVDYLHVYQLVHGDTAHAARHGYHDVALFVERIQLERFFEFEREVIVLNGFDEIADGVHLVPFLRELDHARDEQHGGGFIPFAEFESRVHTARARHLHVKKHHGVTRFGIRQERVRRFVTLRAQLDGILRGVPRDEAAYNGRRRIVVFYDRYVHFLPLTTYFFCILSYFERLINTF